MTASDRIALDDDTLDAAGVPAPGILRSLDATHVAAALTLGDDLDALVTFDERKLAASASLGIPTATPG